MDIRLTCLALFSIFSITSIVSSATSAQSQSSPANANGPLILGLWSLTTQPQAITLEDVTKKLHVDPRNYKVEGGPIYYSLSVLNDEATNRSNPPIRAITLSAPAAIPGVQADQELRIRFSDDVCVSIPSVAPYASSPVMTERFPCTDGAACESETTYFAAPGKNRADKRLAIESQLRVSRECSQGVVIAKTFAKDYWLARCPFSYTKQLREDVMTVIKAKYPRAYRSVDFDAPRITDIGGPQISLTLRELPNTHRLEWIDMDIDRCDLSIIRSWQPTLP